MIITTCTYILPNEKKAFQDEMSLGRLNSK